MKVPKFLLIYLFLAIIGTCSVSCNQSEDGVPSIIEINSVKVETDYREQGSNSHNIVDVWAFVEEDNLGAYELPNKLHVLKEGNTTITLFPGILRSGLQGQRAIYPFYDGFEYRANLEKLGTEKIVPVFEYRPNVKFTWLEDFEDISLTIDSVPGSLTDLSRIEDPNIVYEGSFCGGIILDQVKNKFTGRAQPFFTLPRFGNDVYLEIDLRSNLNLEVLLKSYFSTGTSATTSMLVIKPTEDDGFGTWKKIYVYMTPYVSAAEEAQAFQIYFNSQLTNGMSSGYVYIDNLKIVHQ